MIVLYRKHLLKFKQEPKFNEVARCLYIKGSLLVIKENIGWDDILLRLEKSKAVYVWIERLCTVNSASI